MKLWLTMLLGWSLMLSAAACEKSATAITDVTITIDTIVDTVRVESVDTLIVNDTVVVNASDTLVIVDTLFVTDTLVTIDTIIDTLMVIHVDTLYVELPSDTVTIYDTVTVTDTLVCEPRRGQSGNYHCGRPDDDKHGHDGG